MRITTSICWLACPALVSGFVIRPYQPVCSVPATVLHSSSNKEEVVVTQQHAMSAGTLVEFEEKTRFHIGTVKSFEHKSTGGARYMIESLDGQTYDVADKAVAYSTPGPTNANKAVKLLAELAAAQDMSEEDLYKKLNVSPELLELSWEEAADEKTEEVQQELTAKAFMNLVHGRAPSAIEEYMAWRLLKGETAHVFFKDMKQNGRVLSFKAKTSKAVDNSKDAYCATHEDDELCLTPQP